MVSEEVVGTVVVSVGAIAVDDTIPVLKPSTFWGSEIVPAVARMRYHRVAGVVPPFVGTESKYAVLLCPLRFTVVVPEEKSPALVEISTIYPSAESTDCQVR